MYIKKRGIGHLSLKTFHVYKLQWVDRLTFVMQAAAVSALAGTFASLPFTIAVDGGLTLGALLSQVGILVSCALFGVTYRYAIRRDLGNLQLKSGVAAAFGLVRGERVASISLEEISLSFGPQASLLPIFTITPSLENFGFA